ncbi:hypothetical protein EL22_19220 [Halostagnicola sp. A56]|uniref:hypothetical protein n=1 Tax=Halostagnicola sp. A56 TaxID=1495067 RepID=UPI00049F2167|nr:hypothetical protein [Halostagnicola sp. A56]KDE56852.1 hypothetical protein EL22_19220 [Halostagnicola sp. A56]
MSPPKPFFTSQSGALDTGQILDEALSLAKLIGAVVAVALIPILVLKITEFVVEFTVLQVIFSLTTQFLLAVGSGIVLLYVIIRANQLYDEQM